MHKLTEKLEIPSMDWSWFSVVLAGVKPWIQFLAQLNWVSVASMPLTPEIGRSVFQGHPWLQRVFGRGGGGASL